MKGKYYRFELVLGGTRELDDATADQLYEAGCADATIFSSEGKTYLIFTREADTEIDAITSAIRDVRSVGNGLCVVAVLVDNEEDASASDGGRYLIKVDVAAADKVFITRKDVERSVSPQDMLNSIGLSDKQIPSLANMLALENQLVDAVSYMYRSNDLRQQDSYLMYLHYRAA